MTSILR